MRGSRREASDHIVSMGQRHSSSFRSCVTRTDTQHVDVGGVIGYHGQVVITLIWFAAGKNWCLRRAMPFLSESGVTGRRENRESVPDSKLSAMN
jgi:hypothetical protein